MEFKVIMYIVLGVGYFIFNIYKKSKAPQPENEPNDYLEEDDVYEAEPSGGGSYKTIDDIINNINGSGGTKSKKEPVSRVINEGVDNPERTLRELREEKEEVERVQYEAQLKKTNAYGTVPSTKSKKRKSKFDLRKAVLYRAVMERPKF